MKSFVVSILLLGILVSANQGWSEELRLTPKLITKDFAHVATAPGRWSSKDLTIFAGCMGMVFATMSYADKPVFDNIQQTRENGRVDGFRFIEPFGLQYAYGSIAGFYAIGTIFDKPRARMTARDAISTSLISYGLVEAIKFASGRDRPRRRTSPYEFNPFGGADAFPSGHATTAFGLATVISHHYHPLWMKISAYGLAGLVGVSRIDHNAHFVSDVVAGALLGTAIGHSVVKFNQGADRKDAQTEWMVLPITGDHKKGMAVDIRF
jgi:membrane-associated phospholipid phosphatase